MAGGFPREYPSSSNPALSGERRPMTSAAQPLGGGVLAGDPQFPPPPPGPLSAGEFLLNLLQKRPQSQPDPPPPPPPPLPGGAVLESPGNPIRHGISFLPPGFLDSSISLANPLPPWPDHQVFPPGNWTSLDSRPPPPPGFHFHEQSSQFHHSPPRMSPPGFRPQLGLLGGHLDPRNQQHPNLHHLQHHHHHQQQQSQQLIFGSFSTPVIAESHRSDRDQRNLPDQGNSISVISPRSGPIHPPKPQHVQESQALRHMNSDNLHPRSQFYHQNEINHERIRSLRTNGENLNLIFEEKLKIEDLNQNSISTVNMIEEHKEISNDSTEEREAISEELLESSTIKSSNSSRTKDCRSDFSRGHHVSSQRIRYRRRELRCRRDISSFSPQFLAIYESLTPPEEEKVKQIQLLQYLEKLVIQEWPDARLHLYGSCANSFGASNSDIDVCLQIRDLETEKSEILLRLAEILEAKDLQDVQALTRARVPIVKLKHPATNISCDICINNILAVVNTKLLRDYSQIDHRLRQLVFIVKHWAKSRGVNDTYQGTLSSYAYVLMCIHFLQMRRPAVLPCLQAMQTTYEVKVDGVECAFFDQVEKLRNFGAKNRENIAELLWGFFKYWAYHHDYTHDVISVRTGAIISKQSKDWTRRIGNDRHLVCIEDPFELSHDLGRVVDKFTIKILREEFERAADIMQFDPNPVVRLFEPYVRPPLDQT